MDCRRHYGKQRNKNIDIRKSEKDGSTNKQEKEYRITCGLFVYSFEDKDEWYIDNGCSHHMTGDKSKMKYMMMNHHGNGILGTDVSAKVLGPSTVRTDS